MDHFKLKFLEEANDLLDDLEKHLLGVESKGLGREAIENIFRVMHTLKGSSSMFGFDAISEFTHHLETIYDLIRNDKMSFSNEILEVTLSSVDHIHQLLLDSDLKNLEVKKVHGHLSEKIEALIATSKPSSLHEAVLNAEEKAVPSTFYILFKPDRQLLKKGNNPLYLLQDLQDLGQSKIVWHFHDIPSALHLQVQECYVYWEVFLSCDCGKQAIREVFMFVEDQCELEVQLLGEENMFLNPVFVSFLETMLPKQERADVSGFLLPTNKVKEAVESKPEDRANEKTVLGKESSIRVSSDKLDVLLNLVSELVTTQARLSLYANDNANQSELYSIAENIEKISRQLRDNTFSICLIPVETMITRFQRLVRDLSKLLNKEVVFLSEGTETEIDKTIIDNLTDPLMHILRNCMDHGIEDADIRQKKGKPRQGTILLRAYYAGTNVHIEIKDDGAGIDKARIREKAISKGLVSEEAVLTDKEIYDLMFLPGFSTASQITEVSGRGVGMDVVKRQITAIRGSVEVESVLGEGTTITISLPLTLSIIDGLLVAIHDTKYVLPLAVVQKCYEIETQELLQKFDDLLMFEGEMIPFVNLRKEFKIEDNAPDIQQVVVVTHQCRKIGITVDYVIGQYQAVLKPLGHMYKDQEYMSGATILGDGTIALVMDTHQMIKKIIQKQHDYMETAH